MPDGYLQGRNLLDDGSFVEAYLEMGIGVYRRSRWPECSNALQAWFLSPT